MYLPRQPCHTARIREAPMSKGWTIEVAIEDAARWGDKAVSVQLFDVAIEDLRDAEAAVRQRAGDHVRHDRTEEGGRHHEEDRVQL